MLPRDHRLSTKPEITSALRRGSRRSSPRLVVHIAASDRSGPARAAFAVSSAVGNSVVRHRLTRQLRAGLTPLLARLPRGTDLVVRALPAARGASYTDLVADLEHCLRDVAEQPLPQQHVPDQEFPQPSQESPRRGLARVGFILGSPLRWLLIGLVTVYRQVISPVLPPTCRYHPSCSAYALESLQVHGAMKGVLLAAWRLGRCNPFTKGGLDPVPARGSWRPDIYPDGTPRDGCAHPGGGDTTTAAVGLPHNPGALTIARTPEA